jgi:hypothetical protein
MAHLETVDEDVERQLPRQVHEVQLLVAEERVLLLVRREALGDEELGERLAVLATGGDVDVGIRSLLTRPSGRQRAEGEPAHQPDLEALGVGQLDDPQRLPERLRARGSSVAGLGTLPPSRVLWRSVAPAAWREVAEYRRLRHPVRDRRRGRQGTPAGAGASEADGAGQAAVAEEPQQQRTS